METFFTIIFFILFIFLFFNRANQNMPLWVRWLGWAIFIAYIIFRATQ